MSDGGSIVNRVSAIALGENVTVEIITSHDSVSIGGITFKRDDLLFAMGVVEEHHTPDDNQLVLVGPMGETYTREMGVEQQDFGPIMGRHSYQCSACGYHPCVCTE